jgi:TolB-like protein/class 3 adenylate cyclase
LASKRLDRRLSAVLAADVAGYSRLVGADEEGTIGQLKAHRAALFDAKLAEHHGRLVKTTGDGLLAEFASVVDAVRCAVDVQRGMAARNADVAPDRRIEFRIGVHVGDIIVEDNDIFGEGVNVAARLEGLAAPGGICVSARVQEDVEGRLDVGFADEGEQQLKNITRPVRVRRLLLDGAEAKAMPVAAAKSAELPFPDRLSIAVLPFQNMSADSDQDYFADGMVEDIITGLSHYRHMYVIARNSTFTYKGRAVDVRQVGRELGVRFVLEGSVRKAGSRIRITGQLIDAATAAHIWAEHFEGGIEDIFDLQDQVAAKVVGAIEPEMRRAETARARRRPTDNPDAHLCLMRGLASLDKWNKAGIDEAMRLAHQAIELDPAYSAPYGLALSCYIMRKANRWVADVAQDRAEAARLTAQAVEVGRDDAISLSLSGFAIAYVLDDLDAGAILIDRALAITPNFAMVLGHSGYVRVWLGEPQLAIDHLQRAMRLSPVDPLFFMMQAALAMAHFIAGRDDEAFAWAEKAAQRNPFFAAATWTAAASAANLGRSEDAAKHVARLRQIDPGVTMPTIEERLSLRRPQDRARLIDSLRKAGLAE